MGTSNYSANQTQTTIDESGDRSIKDSYNTDSSVNIRDSGNTQNTLTIRDSGNATGGVAGSTVGGNVTIQSLDAGAIKGGLDAARDALDFADRAVGVTTGAAVKLGTGAFDLAGAAIADSRAARVDTYDFADRQTQRLSASFSDSLGVVTKQNDAARADLVNIAGRGFSAIDNTVDSAFDALDKATAGSLGTLSQSIQKITGATTDSIAAVAKAGRSETAAGFDNLLKYGAIGLAVLGFAFVYAVRK